MLAKSVEDAIANLTSGFGCHVSKCDAGSASRDHQRHTGRLLADFCGYMFHFIRNDDILIDAESGLLQMMNHGRARAIDPKPLKTRVANRNNQSLHSCDFTCRWDGLVTEEPQAQFER